MRGRSLVFADIDPTAPRVRPFDAFTGQQIAGYSAGCAVLWKRDGATLTTHIDPVTETLHLPAR